MKALKVFSYVATAVIAVVLALYVVDDDNVDENESIEEHVAGLIACVETRSCKLTTTEDSVQGLTFRGVYHTMPEKNANIKYMIGNGVVMVVVVANNGKDQFTLTDVDIDGYVDNVGVIKDGKVVLLTDLDPEPWQRLYDSTMRVAWRDVVPDHLKKEIIKLRRVPLEMAPPPPPVPQKKKFIET